MWQALKTLHQNIKARFLRYWRAREVLKVVNVMHVQELAQTPVNMWVQMKIQHAQDIAAVKAGNFSIIDRRSWAYPYIPEALHRLNQPILKNTPYNLRRFTETPIPRRALNLVKNALLSLKWRVSVDEDRGYDKDDPDSLKNIEIAEYCLTHPNLQDSWRTLMEAVIEDFLIGGYGTMEPQLTPDYRRPIKLWAVDGSCVSKDTEVLTRDSGWKFWPQVTKEDWLATQSPKTGKFEWQKPFYLHKSWFKGDLYQFSTQGRMDALLTPNHRMFGRRVLGDPNVGKYPGRKEFLTAEEIKNLGQWPDGTGKFQIPMTSKWEGKLPKGFSKDGKIPITLMEGVHRISLPGKKGFQSFSDVEKVYWVDLKDWLAFLGIYIAEGCVSGVIGKKKKPSGWHYVASLAAATDFEAAKRLKEVREKRLYSCTVSQKRTSRWYGEIKDLLERLPFGFHEQTVGGFTTVRKGLHGHLFSLGNKYTKRIPQWIKDLPPQYLDVFVEWACKGDGYFRDGVRGYVTASKQLADDMQEVFQKLGRSASIHISPSGRKEMFGKWYRTAPTYFVQERKLSWLGMNKPQEVPYEDYVYCASVPNETLYMRRNGLPFWSANTIRIYADWTEATPDRPHYAQLTGLKGERGIISFLDDELIYIRDNVRSSTPFGLGRMEVAFLTCNAFLGAQDMSSRAGADQIHKTWLWWTTNVPPGHLETVKRHIQNEAEGQAKVSLMTGLPKPEIVEITPVTPEDLLLEWQELLIRIMAAAFELSPMALGLERDVNRNTAAVMAEQDFNSAVVPAARKVEESITRQILHRALGWLQLKFEFVGLEDPDEMIQVQLVRNLYSCNSITPDEIRDRMQIGSPLQGGWGKLTMAQTQLIMAAAVGKGGGAGSSSGMMGGGGGGGMGSLGSGLGGGMGMGAAGDRRYVKRVEGAVPSLWASPFNAMDVSQMDPDTLELYRQAGLVPSDPNQLMTDMESQQPGILQTLSEELLEYFEWLDQAEEEEEVQPSKVTTGDQAQQQKKFKDRMHQITREEQMARGRDFRTNVYEQGGYRGPVPRRTMFGPGKSRRSLPYTGRTR